MAIINIDNALGNIGLKRIVNYSYFIRDFLFDSISYFLNSKISSITLRKVSTQCLWKALISKDLKVKHYLRFSLSSKNLLSVCGVNDYLQKMECGVTNGGLWADFTIFFWLTQFIKHPLEAWSTRTCKPYMNVGIEFNASEKLILMYHEGMNGHFKLVTYLERHDSCFPNNITTKEHIVIGNIQPQQNNVFFITN